MSDRGTNSGSMCPKCQGAMVALERSGVTIEPCGDCRGVFLGTSELERLVEAEDAHYGATAPGQPRVTRPRRATGPRPVGAGSGAGSWAT